MWILTKSRFNENWKFTRYYWTYMLKQNLLLVFKAKSRLSKLCYVTLVPVLIEESRGPKHNRLVLSKALHPSSFHCCHLQELFHVLVVSILIVLCVLQCAPRWDLLCQRNSVERELSIKRRLDMCPRWTLSLYILSQAFLRRTSDPELYATVEIPELQIASQPLIYAQWQHGKLQQASVDHISNIMKRAIKAKHMGSMMTAHIRGASVSKIAQPLSGIGLRHVGSRP
jgi:hypothetical protein